MWGQNSALTASLRDFNTSDIFSSQLDQATADVIETWGELCYKRELKLFIFIYKIYSHLEYCIQFLAPQKRSGVDILESIHSLDSTEHIAQMLKPTQWVPTPRFTSLNIKFCCSLRCHRLFHLTSRSKNHTKTWVGRTELYFQNVLTHSVVTNIFQGGQVFQGLVRSSFEKLKGQRFHYFSGTVLWCFITLIDFVWSFSFFGLSYLNLICWNKFLLLLSFQACTIKNCICLLYNILQVVADCS